MSLLPWQPLAVRRACKHGRVGSLIGCLPGSSGFYCLDCGEQLSSVLGDTIARQQTSLNIRTGELQTKALQ